MIIHCDSILRVENESRVRSKWRGDAEGDWSSSQWHWHHTDKNDWCRVEVERPAHSALCQRKAQHQAPPDDSHNLLTLWSRWHTIQKWHFRISITHTCSNIFLCMAPNNTVQLLRDGTRRLCLCLLWHWPLTFWPQNLITTSRKPMRLWANSLIGFYCANSYASAVLAVRLSVRHTHELWQN